MKLFLKTLAAIALVVGIIAFAVLVGGCAIFDAPEPERVPIKPTELCTIAYDASPWNMAKGGYCKGWVRI